MQKEELSKIIAKQIEDDCARGEYEKIKLKSKIKALKTVLGERHE